MFQPGSGYSDELPSVCAPTELPELCMMKIERNEAEDRLAISEAARMRDDKASATQKAEAVRTAAWWKEYAKGAAVQHNELLRFEKWRKRLCGWHGAQTTVEAEICK
jgi:hypothetical protein